MHVAHARSVSCARRRNDAEARPPTAVRGGRRVWRVARYARLYAYAASQGNAAKPGKIRYGVTRLRRPLRAQRRTGIPPASPRRTSYTNT